VNRAAIKPTTVMASIELSLRYDWYLVFDYHYNYSYIDCNNLGFAFAVDDTFWKGRFK
jgi:hypothetical protein